MAITTVAKLNIYLGEADTTTAKTAAVNAAIGYVQDYCERTFDATRYRKWVKLPETRAIILEDRPIVAVNRCCLGAQNYVSLVLANTTATSATVSVSETGIRVCTYDPTNGILTEDAPFSTYLKTSSLVAGIAAIATLDTWTVAALIDADCYSLKPAAPQDVLNTTVYLEGPDDDIGYGLDVDAGIIYLAGGASGWFYLDYTAGYSTIPAGLEQIATELAATLLSSNTINTSLQSERIGDYQYTLASGSGGEVRGVLAPFDDRLSLYRKRSL